MRHKPFYKYINYRKTSFKSIDLMLFGSFCEDFVLEDIASLVIFYTKSPFKNHFIFCGNLIFDIKVFNTSFTTLEEFTSKNYKLLKQLIKKAGGKQKHKFNCQKKSKIFALIREHDKNIYKIKLVQSNRKTLFRHKTLLFNVTETKIL